MRVAVHVEDIMYGYQEVATGQQLSREADFKNITGDKLAELEKEASTGSHGVHGFGSTVFANIAGPGGGAGISKVNMGLMNVDANTGANNMCELLKDFGYEPKAKAKARGRANVVTATAAPPNHGTVSRASISAPGTPAMSTASDSKADSKFEAAQSVAGTSTSLEGGPGSARKHDVPAMRLRLKDMLSQKLKASRVEATACLASADALLSEHTAHTALSTADQSPLEAWKNIMDARRSLANHVLHGDVATTDAFWNGLANDAKDYCNVTKAELRLLKSIEREARGTEPTPGRYLCGRMGCELLFLILFIFSAFARWPCSAARPTC